MPDRTIWKYSLIDAIAADGATTDHPVIAMKHGYAVEATPWADDPAAWMFVAFVATAGEPT